MNKIYYFILFCFTALCFTACNDDDPEFNGIEGKDHYISDFALSVGGITYQATITGDKITVEIPYNTDLEGATAAYTLSEGATINPNPSTIQDWENEWKFVVTSKMQESKVYSYTYQYTDIRQSGSVVLATQAEVDNFAETGINKIDGNLTIGTVNGEEITNLAGLVNLRQISNTLVINPSYTGTDLSGLDNLEQIGSFKLGSSTSISKNTTLKTVNLPSLFEVVGDFVINSSTVEKVSIPKVETISEDMYVASDALLDLDANAVESIGSSLIIRGSVTKKESAATEAIVFSALKRIGNELTIQYFPKLQGIYLPALEEVTGAASFCDMSSIGSIAMTELYSVGGLDIKNCKELSTIELPNLTSCGEFCVDANKVNKFNISALRDAFGNMTLSYLPIEELDLSQVNFNGNTLTLQCDQLKKIVGPETFNGSLLLLPTNCRLTEFTLDGILNIQGDFECKDYFYVKSFVMPFVKVAGGVTIALNKGSVNTGVEIEFPKLQEIGGTLILGENTNANKIDFPLLKRILGSCSVTTSSLKNDIEFSNLESIGVDGTETDVAFSLDRTNISCPKLKTIYGNFTVITSSSMFGMTADNLSFSTLESIYGNLSITCLYSDFGPNGINSIDFSGLKSAKSISISGQADVNDFSSFKYLFENNILRAESQWSVVECGYNPTFEDMKAGRYKRSENAMQATRKKAKAITLHKRLRK